MLLMNGVWDFISFISICINTSCCAPIAGMHLGLWLDQLDQTNPAAIFLMSLCMLTLCTARVCVCIDESLWSVAVFSYFIEFLFGSVGARLQRSVCSPSCHCNYISLIFLTEWLGPTPSAAPSQLLVLG